MLYVKSVIKVLFYVKSNIKVISILCFAIKFFFARSSQSLNWVNVDPAGVALHYAWSKVIRIDVIMWKLTDLCIGKASFSLWKKCA